MCRQCASLLALLALAFAPTRIALTRIALTRIALVVKTVETDSGTDSRVEIGLWKVDARNKGPFTQRIYGFVEYLKPFLSRVHRQLHTTVYVHQSTPPSRHVPIPTPLLVTASAFPVLVFGGAFRPGFEGVPVTM